jgi:RimJ/RimL family protein N-acetyltransferase
MVTLVSIYRPNGDLINSPDAATILWQLLAERDPIANISHKAMPAMSDHVFYIAGRPHKEWWLIRAERPPRSGASREWHYVGACYLSKNYEIGIQIFKEYQRNGYGRAVIAEIMRNYAGHRLLANIAPGNEASRLLFQSFGFQLIQHTYSLETA